ncbi:MAG: YciI family protein [Burkholderiales bacterium]|nr:YciI family protein [Opitutaceae bacterium]
MKYLAAVYMDEKRRREMPDAEWERLIADCIPYGEELRRSGHLLSGAPLHPPSTATTLRLNGDQLVVTDGPFAETKEVLGGYHLLECKDLDEALAISARWPGLRWGLTLEVRPVYGGGCGGIFLTES